ncbi:MAG: B12-binding domain-containing radical SAM protein [Desulfobacterales bacterium]|nr:B12-binding domain-containing radical SAM protein [Desulfobacterales bacterium]
MMVLNKKHSPKKILFVYLAVGGGYIGFNHGIAALVPVARKYSYEVQNLTLDTEITSEDFRKKIKKFKPSLIGFSVTSPQLPFLEKYSKAIEDDRNVLQIAGGQATTLEPDLVLTQTAVHGIVIGEGEQPLANLLDNMNNKREIYSIPGFYWKKNGKIKRNPIPQFLGDLSQLNTPDPTVFDDFLVCTKNHELKLMLSRGCPYECTYCSNKALKSVYPTSQGYLRYPSVDWAIRYIKKLVTIYPETQNLSFDDDLLIANKSWFSAFASQYKEKINIPYRLNVRPEAVTPEVATILKESGCYMGVIGLECGNETFRKNYLNRRYSNIFFTERCKIIKDAGLLIATFNIVGWPYETEETMQETMLLNRKIQSDSGVCSYFYPFKGTDLYGLCKKNNLLINKDKRRTNFHSGPNIKLTNVSNETCIKMFKEIFILLTGGTDPRVCNVSYSYMIKKTRKKRSNIKVR